MPPSLRVAIDYGIASRHAPGVGRYVRELVRALVRRADSPDLALLDVGRAPCVVPAAALGSMGTRGTLRHRRIAMPRRWAGAFACVGYGADRLVGGADIFHHVFAPDPLRASSALQTLAVSDLPAAGSAAESALRTELARAARVFVFSDAARLAIAARFDVEATRIAVVPVGADHWAREVTGDVARREPLEVLVLGQAAAVRKPLAILDACAMLAQRGLELRLRYVGPKGAPADELARAILRSSIAARVSIEPGREELMPGVVAGAALLVHLNDVEWTAVTPLEAFAAGCPVVASRIPAFEEALGDHVNYVDADAFGLADAMARALEHDDPAARAQRRELASRFAWDANAAATIAAWNALVSQRDSARVSS